MDPLITSYATLKKEHLSAHISSGENIFPDISKWTTDIEIPPQLSNLLCDSRSTSEAQITQTIKLWYGSFIGNYHKYKFIDSNLSIFNTCVASIKTTIVSTYHLVVPINILVIQGPTATTKPYMPLLTPFLSFSTTKQFTLVNALIYNQQHLDGILSSWLLPCFCYLPKCKCLVWFHPKILCIKGKAPPGILSLSSSSHVTVHIKRTTCLQMPSLKNTH